jgi:predicted  nucleic acid-binding Zn-ribbon protein
MNHTTDTPRTDAAKSYWDSAERENCVSIALARKLELEAVTYKNEALSLRDSHDLLYRDYQKLEAEVAKLNHQLLKTEADLLQSQDINSFLDTEFRIACKRAEKAEAEVERLDHLLADASETNHKLGVEVLVLKKQVAALRSEKDACLDGNGYYANKVLEILTEQIK